MVKFRGDRPSELGDPVSDSNKKKTSRLKQKAFGTNVSGGLTSRHIIDMIEHNRRLNNAYYVIHSMEAGSVCVLYSFIFSAVIFSTRQHIACMLSALYAIARPSVRLSVTRVYHIKTVEIRIMKFSPYGSAIPLVFAG